MVIMPSNVYLITSFQQICKLKQSDIVVVGIGSVLYKYSPIFILLRWRHDFLPRFFFIETTETEKKQKKSHVYLLMVTLRLFYAPVNLTSFIFVHLLH
jgi:hypothetical protein